MKTITTYQTSDGRTFALKQDAAYHERAHLLETFFCKHLDACIPRHSAIQVILDNHAEFMEMMHAAPTDDTYDEMLP